MPTAFTHALVGGSLMQCGPPEDSRFKLAGLLVIAAILPDLDVVAFKLGIPYAHPLGHRGMMHSLAFAALVALFFTRCGYRSVKLFSKAGLHLTMLFFCAGASHGLLDAATDAGLGIGLWLPFSDQRVFWDFRPLLTSPVDPTRFFNRRALVILKSEFVWVWVPVIAMTVVFQTGRWVLRVTGLRTPAAVSRRRR